MSIDGANVLVGVLSLMIGVPGLVLNVIHIRREVYGKKEKHRQTIRELKSPDDFSIDINRAWYFGLILFVLWMTEIFVYIALAGSAAAGMLIAADAARDREAFVSSLDLSRAGGIINFVDWIQTAIVATALIVPSFLLSRYVAFRIKGALGLISVAMVVEQALTLALVCSFSAGIIPVSSIVLRKLLVLGIILIAAYVGYRKAIRNRAYFLIAYAAKIMDGEDQQALFGVVKNELLQINERESMRAATA